MKRWRLIQIILLSSAIITAFTIPTVRVAAVDPQIILIRISSGIDYRTADLITSAVADVQQGLAAKLLLELDADGGYYAPSMQLVDQISSIRTKVVVYIGPSGAVSSSFSVFVAMASGILAMNTGTSIGSAGVGIQDSQTVNYLAGVMRSLAVMNSRNGPAAAEMVTRNTDYSADDAYAKGLCDLEVDSYNLLLSALKLDPTNIVERKLDQYPSINNHAGYAFLTFLGDPFVLKVLFIGCGILVMLNLLIALVKPRSSKLDEANRALLELVRMEVLSPDLYRPTAEDYSYEPQTHVTTTTPSTPTFTMTRVPTPSSHSSLEKPIEVRKR